MARTAITATNLAAQGSAAESTTAADPTNGHSVALPRRGHGVLLHAANTAVSAKTVTVKGSSENGFADLVVSVPAESERFISVQETARFVQSGALLHVDLEAGFTGTMGAIVQHPSVNFA